VFILFWQWELAHTNFFLIPAWKFEIPVCSDNSLARPTSLFRRTKSIVSLEREVCSCAELEVSSGFLRMNNSFHAMRSISNHVDASCLQIFFSCKASCRRKFSPFWQKHEEKIHHRMPPSKSGWPVLNVVIFPTVFASSWMTQNCDHPGLYWWNWRTNLGRTPDLG